jgi:hypothetical protein
LHMQKTPSRLPCAPHAPITYIWCWESLFCGPGPAAVVDFRDTG